MIPLRFSSPFKKIKQAWLARQEARWQQEFAPQLQAAQESCQRQLGELLQQKATLDTKYAQLQQLQAQCEAQEAVFKDRQIAVEKASEELRTQLRLLEAKASPDSVWVEAFTKGYEKAWDTMAAIWQEGFAKAVEQSRTVAIEQTLRNINPVRPVHELLLKQQDLQLKYDQAKEPVLRQRYAHYLEALSWSLNGHTLHSDQPVSE